MTTARDVLAMIRDVLMIVVLSGLIALSANVAGRLDGWEPPSVPTITYPEDSCLEVPC
ncbi:hypothetical protein [Actinoplanes sp. M2I2]|uniref:hypothetical protein n=1 Tax=Actinoplanes sp. M2I2 TaxID=1734444 RepID=UPI002021889E|nr:hypothetical protein [Actinoplanes sp. M2I2]